MVTFSILKLYLLSFGSHRTPSSHTERLSLWGILFHSLDGLIYYVAGPCQ
jgi:hypothetical protein